MNELWGNTASTEDVTWPTGQGPATNCKVTQVNAGTPVRENRGSRCDPAVQYEATDPRRLESFPDLGPTCFIISTISLSQKIVYPQVKRDIQNYVHTNCKKWPIYIKQVHR